MPVLFAAALLAAAPSADDVVGRWKTPTRNGIVEVQKCGGSICGRLLTSDGIRTDPGLTDAKNRDAAQRGRPLRGITMLSGFTRDGARWTGGSIYNPEDGKTYSATLTPADADHLSLRGCVFVPLCKTQTWTRVR